MHSTAVRRFLRLVSPLFGAASAAPRGALTALFACATMACCCEAVEYNHRLLWKDMAEYAAGYLSNNGRYFIRSRFASGAPRRLVLDGEFLPESIAGLTDLEPAGVDDDGNWLISGRLPEYPYPRRALYNGVIQTPDWHRGLWSTSGLMHLNPQGKMVWTNGSTVRATVMKQGVDFSDRWTDGWYDRSWDVTPEGKVLWWGRGYGEAKPELWFEGEALARRYDLGEWEVTPGDWSYGSMPWQANDSGQVAWVLKRKGYYKYHVFRGDYDLTAAALGPDGGAWSDFARINSSGRVLWAGAAPGSYGGIFLDETPMFFEHMLPGDTALPQRLNERNDIVWIRTRLIGSRYWSDLFVNDVNLIAGVGVAEYVGARVCDLNDRGEVLWTFEDRSTGKYSLYLSSPVPEPGVALLLLPGALLMLRRRRQRSPGL